MVFTNKCSFSSCFLKVDILFEDVDDPEELERGEVRAAAASILASPDSILPHQFRSSTPPLLPHQLRHSTPSFLRSSEAPHYLPYPNRPITPSFHQQLRPNTPPRLPNQPIPLVRYLVYVPFIGTCSVADPDPGSGMGKKSGSGSGMNNPDHYLKVPKCENFHRTDFFYFYTIKPLWVGSVADPDPESGIRCLFDP